MVVQKARISDALLYFTSLLNSLKQDFFINFSDFSIIFYITMRLLLYAEYEGTYRSAESCPRYNVNLAQPDSFQALPDCRKHK